MDSTEASTTIRVVYVEDDDKLARLTAQYLRAHDIETIIVARGDLAVEAVQRETPDVVLLDLMLPGLGGQEVCRRIRTRSAVPIIMLTARGEEAERVLGLEGGADDYVSKPFSSRELVARVRAQARRIRGKVGPQQRQRMVGDLTLDLDAMTVTLRGQPITLTTQEFTLLDALSERPGRVFKREQLLQLTQGLLSEAFDRSIDVHISRLRTKLGDDPKAPNLIKTVRGVGYMLASHVPTGAVP